MSNNRFVFSGLDELKAALRALPAELAGEASGIVNGAAEGAAAAMRAGYEAHRRSGDLANHVIVSAVSKGQFGAGAVVKSTSKHAWLFEHGSQARHTAIGANRGSMPATPTAVPAIVHARRAMYEQLKALLERKGLVVSGDA